MKITSSIHFDCCPFALAKLAATVTNDSWLYGDIPELTFKDPDWIGETL